MPFNRRYEAFEVDFTNESIKDILHQCRTSEKVQAPRIRNNPRLTDHYYVADTETSIIEGTDSDVRVYLWCIYGRDRFDREQKFTGSNVKSLIDKLFKLDSNRIYFHNLRYDASYIMSSLLRDPTAQYETLVSDDDLVYKITLYRYKGKQKRMVHLMDSYKLLQRSVKALGDTVGLPKLTNDAEEEGVYHKITSDGYRPSVRETAYCYRDCEIVWKALQPLEQVKTLTISGYARKLLKKELSHFAFEHNLAYEYDYKAWRKVWPQYNRATQELLQFCYKGGWVYCNPAFAGKTVLCQSYDVNSHYPAIMMDDLPYRGADKNGNGYWRTPTKDDWYITIFECVFWVKPGLPEIPTVRIKASPYFSNDRWYSDSADTPVLLCMTKEEYEAFKKHHDFYFTQDPKFMCFPHRAPYLKTLIETMGEEKARCSAMINTCLDAGDTAGAQIWEGKKLAEKVKLNSLYGTTGENAVRGRAEYCLDDNGVIRLGNKSWDVCEGVYMPLACYITAMGRLIIQEHWWTHPDEMIYSDTDSCKTLLSFDWPSEQLDPVRFGAFKPEYGAGRWIYPIREKEYITMWSDKKGILQHEVTFAGLNDKAKDDLFWNVFCANGHSLPQKFTVNGCLVQRPQRGGILLKSTPKEIDLSKRDNMIFI